MQDRRDQGEGEDRIVEGKQHADRRPTLAKKEQQMLYRRDRGTDPEEQIAPLLVVGTGKRSEPDADSREQCDKEPSDRGDAAEQEGKERRDIAEDDGASKGHGVGVVDPLVHSPSSMGAEKPKAAAYQDEVELFRWVS